MKNETINPKWLNQQDVCIELGITPPTFRKWACPHVGTKGRAKYYQWRDVVEAYHRYEAKKHLATGQAGDEKYIDRDYEEARRTRADADYRELKNAAIMREIAPIDMLGDVLSQLVQGVDSIMTSIPLNIKRHHPDVPSKVTKDVEREIIKASNLMAKLDIDWSEYDGTLPNPKRMNAD